MKTIANEIRKEQKNRDEIDYKSLVDYDKRIELNLCIIQNVQQEQHHHHHQIWNVSIQCALKQVDHSGFG